MKLYNVAKLSSMIASKSQELSETAGIADNLSQAEQIMRESICKTLSGFEDEETAHTMAFSKEDTQQSVIGLDPYTLKIGARSASLCSASGTPLYNFVWMIFETENVHLSRNTMSDITGAYEALCYEEDIASRLKYIGINTETAACGKLIAEMVSAVEERVRCGEAPDDAIDSAFRDFSERINKLIGDKNIE